MIYVAQLGAGRTGLSTVYFKAFKNVNTGADIAPPPITEVGAGAYRFEWSWLPSDAPIFAQVESAPGSGIIAEALLSPRDSFIDMPVSETGSSGGTIDTTVLDSIKQQTDKIGDAADAASANTLFGKVLAARDAVRGSQNLTISDVAGSGFNASSHSLAVMGAKLLRLLGLERENSFVDNTTHDGNNNMLTGRLRIYDSKVNAENAKQVGNPGTVGLIATYSIVATYTGQNLRTYSQVLEP